MLKSLLTGVSEGYGDVFNAVFGSQRSDGLDGSRVRPLPTLLFLVAHGDLHLPQNPSCQYRGDAAEPEV